MFLLFTFRKQQKITGTVLPEYYGNVTGVNIKKSRTCKNPEYAGKLRFTGQFHGSFLVHYFIVTILYQQQRHAIPSY